MLWDGHLARRLFWQVFSERLMRYIILFSLASLLLPFASIAQLKKPTSTDCKKLGALAAYSPDCLNFVSPNLIPPKPSASTPDWVNVATLTSGGQLNVDKRSIVKNKDKSVEGSFGIVYRVPIFLENYQRSAFSEVFRVRADCQYGRLYNTKPVPYDAKGEDVEVPQVIQDIRKIYPNAPNAPSKFLTPKGLAQLDIEIKELEQERASFKPSSMSDSINNFLFKGLCK